MMFLLLQVPPEVSVVINWLANLNLTEGAVARAAGVGGVVFSVGIAIKIGFKRIGRNLYEHHTVTTVANEVDASGNGANLYDQHTGFKAGARPIQVDD